MTHQSQLGKQRFNLLDRVEILNKLASDNPNLVEELKTLSRRGPIIEDSLRIELSERLFEIAVEGTRIERRIGGNFSDDAKEAAFNILRSVGTAEVGILFAVNEALSDDKVRAITALQLLKEIYFREKFDPIVKCVAKGLINHKDPDICHLAEHLLGLSDS